MDIERPVEKVESDNPFIICDNFLRGSDSAYIIGPDTYREFDEALKLSFDTIHKVDNDIEMNNFSYAPIEVCLNTLKNLTIEIEYLGEFLKFMRAFIFIAHNVNENTIKNKTITDKINYLQRYCDNALTYGENLSMLKILTKRICRNRNWTPPSFRLSEHYYNILKEE